MSTPATTERIVLNFGWRGPSSLAEDRSVKVVDLLFKQAKTEISVSIPDQTTSSALQRLSFTCRRAHGAEGKVRSSTQETHPEALNITVEQIRNLSLRVGLVQKSQDGSASRIEQKIDLKLPEKFENGQTYNLILISNGESISARVRAEVRKSVEQPAEKEELRRRAGAMGRGLVAEGVRNLELGLSGRAGALSEPSDLYAHGIQGVVRAGQQVHPDLAVPSGRPSESSASLDELTVAELQARFEATFKKDKEFEIERFAAAADRNIKKFNEIVQAEQLNSQLLVRIATALEKKGVEPQIPHSAGFRAVRDESAEVHAQAVRDLSEKCKVQ